jgi:hypothetical protein
MQTKARFIVLAAALATSAFGVRSAAALTACTSAQIIAQDASCPSGTGPCTITKIFDVATGCVLDFGTRTVTLSGTGQLRIGSGAVRLLVGSLTMAPSSYIDGRGLGSSTPTNVGGMITIEATTFVNIQRSGLNNGRIDVSGNSNGGIAEIVAGTSITISGKVNADNLLIDGGGGTLRLNAGTDLTVLTGAVVSANGGTTGPNGGTLDLQAGGTADISPQISATGSDGGDIQIVTGGDIILRGGANVNGPGDAGSGGAIDLAAGLGVQILGQLLVRGTDSGTLSGGGDGGFVDILADFGDVVLANDIFAEGADPDGGGGEIAILARGNVTVQSTAILSVRANGADGDGGELALEGLNVTVSGKLDVSGGTGGGEADVTAQRNASIGALIDARGRDFGSVGGVVLLDVAQNVPGTLTITHTIDAGGGGCGDDLGCGTGGSIGLTGCDISVLSPGKLDARAPAGGQVMVGARKTFALTGTINSSRTNVTGAEGSVVIIHPIGSVPSFSPALVSPPATFQPLPLCTFNGQTNCLSPCPVCGNGVTEFPETCDQSGTPAGCDGCSIFCQTENCNDNLFCSTDSCAPQMGCNHVFTPGCVEPPPTATFTPGPPATNTVPGTPSLTPTVTRTATNTATPTNTGTPTRTPTPTQTATATGTPTATGTSTATPTPMGTPVSEHDTVVRPLLPLELNIRAGDTFAAKRLRVKVVNADILPAPGAGHLIRLTASDGNCPPGIIVGAPDFDKRTAGAQDTIFLSGGRQAVATVNVSALSAAFAPHNHRAPQRCRISFTADSTIVGNLDPAPSNNVFPLEISVTDANDPEQTATHETFVSSIRTTSVKLAKGKTAGSKRPAVGAGNGDLFDVAGHGIVVTAVDGNCPAGTVGVADFDGAAPGNQNAASVPAAGLKKGKLLVNATAAGFTARNLRSPARCIAMITGAGPAGDSDSSNNGAWLVIDVVDRNDF